VPSFDVIIPVYRGLQSTQACLRSVLAARNAATSHVIVVDDASPEPELSEWLVSVAREGRIELVCHPQNQGFVRSVNAAMALNPSRDVVLLNSDTLVSDGWLDVLAAHAGAPDVASVSPLSNNATLASYPRVAESNALPVGESEASLAACARRANPGIAVRVPTTVGCCMLITRRALVETGAFDEQTFGKGYGEENDWCMRATAKGFHHLIATDGFVYHEGEVSFGTTADEGKRRALERLAEKHPGYEARIRAHFAADPLREARRRLDIERLHASRRPILLMITHHWGGGTEQHVRDLALLLRGHAEVLVLRPQSAHCARLEWCTGHRQTEAFEAWFELPGEFDVLLRFLGSLPVARVHLHHVHGHDPAVLQLAARLGVPLDITCHDFFPLTPQYHLDPGGAMPADDVAHAWGWPAAQWRECMAALLRTADRVIFPSADIAARIREHCAVPAAQVWSHPEAPSGGRAALAKVLLLGGLTRAKGQDVVLACAREAAARGLPLAFRVLGHTEDALPVYPQLPLTVAGSYRAADLDALIALERADVVWLPARIPESFSYTLSAALRSGLPIVASRLGAFTERLKDTPRAILVAWNAEPEVWLDALLTSAGPRPLLPPADETQWRDYRERYLEPIRAGRAAAPVAQLAPRHFLAPRELPREAERSLATLFAGGVECGNAATLAELRARIASFDAELANARDAAGAAHEMARAAGRELDEAGARFQAAFEEQQRAAQAAHAAYQGILDSTTWRMTAPLRNAAHRLKVMKRRVARLLGRVDQIPQRAANVAQVLREEGVAGVGRRLHDKLTGRDDPFTLPLPSYQIERAMTPLRVPSSGTPEVSILIPVFGQHLHTYSCLASIARTCAGRAIEVLVADDASPEPAEMALAMVDGVRFVRQPRNLGFVDNCNAAAAEARGTFLLFLNNDTQVLDGWLDAMLEVFASEPKAGLVGAKLLFADGRLQDAGGIVWRDGSASNHGRGEDPRRPEYNYRRDADYCTGACMLIRRETWQALGGFDRRYVPAYYEDTDLAFRVREAGLRVIYQPHAEVVHFEGQTSGTDLTQGVKRHQVDNQAVFAERWRHVLANHRPRGVAPHRECDRAAQRRVLVIDVCVPMPDRDSGSLRMFEMLRLMRELGCRVSFVGDNGLHLPGYVRAVQALGVEVLHAPYFAPLSAVIEQRAAEYDIVILSRAFVAVKYIDLVKRHMPQAKLLFDTVDLHFLREQREAALHADAERRAAAEAARERELELIGKADVTLVVSAFERELLEREAPRARVHVLSNIHEPRPGPAPFEAREGMLFIGGFRHAPNVDAIDWFAREVMPRLRAAGAGLKLTVIGSDVPEELKRHAAGDFEFAGFVPDVEPLFARARLAVSPLRYGAGVKGKVNLAMQFGVPVIATPCAVEGMHLQDGVDVLVAEGAEAFAAATLRAYQDAGIWQTLRAGGLANVERWFSRDQARRTLRHLFDL
jgi:GT2 family glycosyltransferase